MNLKRIESLGPDLRVRDLRVRDLGSRQDRGASRYSDLDAISGSLALSALDSGPLALGALDSGPTLRALPEKWRQWQTGTGRVEPGAGVNGLSSEMLPMVRHTDLLTILIKYKY